MTDFGNQKQSTQSKGRRGGRRPGAGRKRGIPKKASTQQINDLAEAAKVYAYDALATLWEIATEGESEAARATAASAILDRGYGKPRQALEHSGAGGGPLEVIVTRTIVRP